MSPVFCYNDAAHTCVLFPTRRWKSPAFILTSQVIVIKAFYIWRRHLGQRHDSSVKGFPCSSRCWLELRTAQCREKLFRSRGFWRRQQGSWGFEMWQTCCRTLPGLDVEVGQVIVNEWENVLELLYVRLREETLVSKQSPDQSPPLGLDSGKSGARLCADGLRAQRSVPAFPSQQEVNAWWCHGIEDVSCGWDDQFCIKRRREQYSRSEVTKVL